MGEVGDESHHFAQGQFSPDNQKAAKPDDNDGGEIGDQVQQRDVQRSEPGSGRGQAEPLLIFGLKSVDLCIFLGKCLDNAGAAQILFQPRRQHCQLLLNLDRQGPVACAENRSSVRQYRH